MASPSRRLDLLDADQFRGFVREQVGLWQVDSTAFSGRHPPTDTIFTKHFADSAGKFSGLDSKHLGKLGPANTNWEREINRSSALTHNHNLSFAGGSEDTRFRASLNYMNQEGVARSSGFERVQGRLNATHSAFDNRLRLGLNVTSSHTIQRATRVLRDQRSTLGA